MTRLCSGREKLGDGTVAANAQHIADNYQRIAAFVQTGKRTSAAGDPTPLSAHRPPGFLRRFGHQRPDHGENGTGAHANHYTADGVDPGELINQLSASRHALEQIATLSDNQLHTIPPERSFRFCDGQRTLAQVLTNLLKHQAHQIQALKASLE